MQVTCVVGLSSDVLALSASLPLDGRVTVSARVSAAGVLDEAATAASRVIAGDGVEAEDGGEGGAEGGGSPGGKVIARFALGGGVAGGPSADGVDGASRLGTRSSSMRSHCGCEGCGGWTVVVGGGDGCGGRGGAGGGSSAGCGGFSGLRWSCQSLNILSSLKRRAFWKSCGAGCFGLGDARFARR